jgi:molybdopterin/thiamine biosynthesis adenylyltransferase
MPEVGRVVLVDPDVYEPTNLAGQDIRAADVGRKKVEVQAERLRQIRPDLEVVAVAAGLETLPFAYFRDAIVFGALDSRLARLRLNQAAWRAGSPWIDTAVDGSGLLCRVSVFRPGLHSPCLECGWDADDYRSLHQVLPCDEIAGTDGREGE